MIVTLSGITGTGKSFFKDAISKELNFKNLAIVTTRNKRKNEVNGIDKEFVSEEEFEKLVKNKEVVVDFEFLGAKYGYRKEKLESSENQVTEVHYSTIYEIKKHTPNIFSIYIIPKDIERAKIELKNRDPIYQKQIVFLIIQTGYIFLRQCLTRIGKWFYTPIITQTRMYGNIFVSIDKISLLCIIDKFDIIKERLKSNNDDYNSKIINV